MVEEKTEIPVENSYFSTFSTDFSTGVFHNRRAPGNGGSLYIMHL